MFCVCTRDSEFGPLSLSIALSAREFRFTGLIRISYPRLPKWQPGAAGPRAGTLHVKLDKSVPRHAFDEGGVHTYFSQIPCSELVTDHSYKCQFLPGRHLSGESCPFVQENFGFVYTPMMKRSVQRACIK